MPVYDIKGNSLPVLALGASQNVSFNGSAGASVQLTTALKATTQAVLISVPSDQSDVRVNTGYPTTPGGTPDTNPMASSTSTLVLKGAMVMVQVNPGGQIAFLSNDASAGALNVTELVIN